MELEVTDECKAAIAKFTELSEDVGKSGSGTNKGWEHSRSYAVEALTALLYANPQAFDHRYRMEKIRADRYGNKPVPHMVEKSTKIQGPYG